MKKKIVIKNFFQCSNEDERKQWWKQMMKKSAMPYPFIIKEDEKSSKEKPNEN